MWKAVAMLEPQYPNEGFFSNAFFEAAHFDRSRYSRMERNLHLRSRRQSPSKIGYFLYHVLNTEVYLALGCSPHHRHGQKTQFFRCSRGVDGPPLSEN